MTLSEGFFHIDFNNIAETFHSKKPAIDITPVLDEVHSHMSWKSLIPKNMQDILVQAAHFPQMSRGDGRGW